VLLLGGHKLGKKGEPGDAGPIRACSWHAGGYLRVSVRQKFLVSLTLFCRIRIKKNNNRRIVKRKKPMKLSPQLGLRACLCVSSLLISTSLVYAANPMRVSLGGYFSQSIAIVDVDDTERWNIEDESLDQNAEIYFKGKAMLNNGTEVGLRVELEASDQDDQIDEHYVYLKGSWGKVIMGAENGVAHLAHIGTPRFVPGLSSFDNELSDTIILNSLNQLSDTNSTDGVVPMNLTLANITTSPKYISGDANKLSYFTPKVSGFQAGVSFAPNNENLNGGDTNLLHVTKQEDIFEYSVSYDGNFSDDWDYEVSYTKVQANSATSNIDPESESLAFGLTYENWVFGVSQTVSDNLDQVDALAYAGSQELTARNTVIGYRTDKYSLGVSILQSDEDASDGQTQTEFEDVTFGGGIKLAEGVGVGFYFTQAEISKPPLSPVPSADIGIYGVTLDLRF
jgi:outer membrane protein OmpU